MDCKYVRKGTKVRVCARKTPPGHGLTYDAFEGAMLEDGSVGESAGWDVYDIIGKDGETVSAYGFDIRTI